MPTFPFAQGQDPAAWERPVAPPPVQGQVPPTGTYADADGLTVLECALEGRTVRVRPELEPLLREQWALANVEVLAALRFAEVLAALRAAHAAADEPGVTRCLKLHFLLPALLNRETRRGGRQGAAELAGRYAQWQRHDYAGLIAEYRVDCARAAAREARRRGDGEGDEERLIRRVEALLSKGKISGAARLLESFGVADIHDPAILRQMVDKHPGRGADAALPPPPEDTPVLRVCPERVAEALRALDDDKAAGPTAWTNHLLRVLAPTVPFQTPLANQVVPELAHYAELLLNGALPPWAYGVYAATRLVPLNKTELAEGAPADARPVGIGCCVRRALTRTAFIQEEVQQAFRDYLFPAQLAVCVPNGASLLVFSLYELLDVHKDFCLITIDFKNAFNTLRREACMRALLGVGPLARFARMCYAFLMPKSAVYAGPQHGLEKLPFASEEGVQQGSVEGAPFFCTALQPKILAADAALAGVGGKAGAGADDVHLVGPPVVAVQAAEALIAAAAADLGIDVNMLKCHCYIDPAHAGLLEEVRGRFPWGSALDAEGQVRHPGVTVYGVPVGSKEYIKIVLKDKCARVEAIANKLKNTLGCAHKQLLWLITYYSTSRKLDYWLRHCYPEDIAEAARRFDDIIRRLTTVALGCDPWADPVAAERVRLPGRKGGLGLRAAATTAPAAFLAGLVSAVQAFPDEVQEVNGVRVVLRRGVLERPAVVARIGRDAFARMSEDPGPQGGWHRFQTSGSRLGATMVGLWGVLQARAGVGQRAEEDAKLRVLGLPPHRIWQRTEAGLQADICADQEDWAYELLWRGVARGPPSRARAVLVHATRETLAWTTALPQRRAERDQVWVEITTHSLGLASPVWAPLVGLQCGRAAGVVDAFGDVPCAERWVPGHHFSLYRHNPLCVTLAGIMREAGAPATREDAAAFAGVPMANAELLRRLFAAAQSRRLPTPDITVDLPGGPGAPPVPTIVEVKTFQYCPSRYRASDAQPRVAASRRAAAVPAERRRDLAALDRSLFNTPAGVRGPFESRLDAFPGGVVGVAVGAFGEWSESLVDLVDRLAEHGAERWMGRLAAPSLRQARATLRRIWRARLGMCALRGYAALAIARAQEVYRSQGRRGGPSGARRGAGAPIGAGPEVEDSEFARAAEGAFAWYCAGSRGAPGGRAVRGLSASREWARRAARARG